MAAPLIPILPVEAKETKAIPLGGVALRSKVVRSKVEGNTEWVNKRLVHAERVGMTPKEYQLFRNLFHHDMTPKLGV